MGTTVKCKTAYENTSKFCDHVILKKFYDHVIWNILPSMEQNNPKRDIIFRAPFQYKDNLSRYNNSHDLLGGLVQEIHNSSALAMELCLSCINPSI